MVLLCVHLPLLHVYARENAGKLGLPVGSLRSALWLVYSMRNGVWSAMYLSVDVLPRKFHIVQVAFILHLLSQNIAVLVFRYAVAGSLPLIPSPTASDEDEGMTARSITGKDMTPGGKRRPAGGI